MQRIVATHCMLARTGAPVVRDLTQRFGVDAMSRLARVSRRTA